MRIRKYTPPLSILLFLALTLAGTYYVRKMILERAMGYAVEAGDEKSIRGLARSWPSPVNARNKRGTSALVWAAEDGSLESVALLIDLGADVNAQAMTVFKIGKYTLTRNAYHGPPKGPYYTIDWWRTTPVSALYVAIMAGRSDVVELLLKSGADPNLGLQAAALRQGESPLECALRLKKEPIVERLRKAGAME